MDRSFSEPSSGSAGRWPRVFSSPPPRGAPLQRFYRWVKSAIRETNSHASVPCTRGCYHCCAEVSVNLTEAEGHEVRQGFERLGLPRRTRVLERARTIVESRLSGPEHQSSPIERYSCPFLFESVCSIYAYRPLACRLFGLATIDESNHYGCGMTHDEMKRQGTDLLQIRAVTAPFFERSETEHSTDLPAWILQNLVSEQTEEGK